MAFDTKDYLLIFIAAIIASLMQYTGQICAFIFSALHAPFMVCKEPTINVARIRRTKEGEPIIYEGSVLTTNDRAEEFKKGVSYPVVDSLVHISCRFQNLGKTTARKCRAFVSQIDYSKDGKVWKCLFHDFLPLTWAYDPSTKYWDFAPGTSRNANAIAVHMYGPSLVHNDKLIAPPHTDLCLHAMNTPCSFEEVFDKSGLLKFTSELTSDDSDTALIIVTLRIDFSKGAIECIDIENRSPNRSFIGRLFAFDVDFAVLVTTLFFCSIILVIISGMLFFSR